MAAQCSLENPAAHLCRHHHDHDDRATRRPPPWRGGSLTWPDGSAGSGVRDGRLLLHPLPAAEQHPGGEGPSVRHRPEQPDRDRPGPATPGRHPERRRPDPGQDEARPQGQRPTSTSASTPSSGPPSSPAWSGSTRRLYGDYGVEASYNYYLVAHNKPVTSLKDLLTTGGPITDTVTLTISTKLQQAARGPRRTQVGAIVALDPQTGAVLAMYSNPTYDPNPLASLNGHHRDSSPADRRQQGQPRPASRPSPSLAYQDATFGPGSTFKTVTTAAAYDHAPQLVNTPMPVLQPPSPRTTSRARPPRCPTTSGGACGGTIAADAARVVRHRLRHPRHQGRAAGHDGRGRLLRLQPAAAHRPAPQSVQVSDFLQPSCYERGPGLPGLLLHRPEVHHGQPPADGHGGRRPSPTTASS